MKKLFWVIAGLLLGIATANGQSSISPRNIYLLNEQSVLNKAGTSFLLMLERSTAYSEVVLNLDYINQIKFRNSTAYTFTLRAATDLGETWTGSLPSAAPDYANSILLWGTDGTSSFAQASPVGNGAMGSTWDDQDSLVTQNIIWDSNLRRKTVSFTVLDTVKTGGEVVWAWKVPFAITIVEIASHTDVNTVTFNIEQRAETTPNTAGTDCMSSDQVADTDQQETTSFADATVPQNYWLVCAVTSAGDVTRFCVTIRYTID